MSPNMALEQALQLAPGMLELPLDDERLPGLAHVLARAVLALDESMRDGDVPLDWRAR